MLRETRVPLNIDVASLTKQHAIGDLSKS